MTPTSPLTAEITVLGLYLSDLYENAEFVQRPSRGADIQRQMDGVRRIAEAFVVRPEHIFSELATAAVELCQADSAGVTVETRDEHGRQGLQWVAVAGQFTPFNNACFPYVNTACGTAIERGAPQHFRMEQPFYDTLGITADPVTDGILIPWRAGTTRGTVWIMAHDRTEAFDVSDAKLMGTLASFAAMAMRQKRQHQMLLEQASAAAAASMANQLAHSINNPLQSLTNLLYIASMDPSGLSTRELAQQMSADLARLSELVKGLLALPVARTTDRPSPTLASASAA